jgi:hypothetical protein
VGAYGPKNGLLMDHVGLVFMGEHK